MKFGSGTLDPPIGQWLRGSSPSSNRIAQLSLASLLVPRLLAAVVFPGKSAGLCALCRLCGGDPPQDSEPAAGRKCFVPLAGGEPTVTIVAMASNLLATAST